MEGYRRAMIAELEGRRDSSREPLTHGHSPRNADGRQCLTNDVTEMVLLTCVKPWVMHSVVRT
jgi:hypothetical protein